jgi:putative PIG3 family NAD(P)H quinone oxidoreductase
LRRSIAIARGFCQWNAGFACGVRTWALDEGREVAEMAGETLPGEMTAIGFDRPGGPEVLRPQVVPVPHPGPGELLIRTAFAGVNRPDAIQRQGFYPPPPGASPIPGLELSGTVVALGEGVDPALLGQPVCALVTGGGYAQYCLARPGHCLPVPAGLSLAEAAAMPETLFTVWHNVFERGWAKEGETLLVHGGTSGIGSMAIMVGKLFGLAVLTTCGSDEKCDAARAIGADLAVNYRTQDFVEEVTRFTDGKGVELVLDMVAGDYVPRNLKCLAEDGRYVAIAVLGGASATINVAQLMVRRATLTGSTLRARSDTFKELLAQEIAQVVWPLVEEGRLRPVMDRTFPLAEAGAAHRRMEAGEHVGKIVLDAAG